MDDNEQIALGNGHSKFIVDVHLPDHKGETAKLRTYYDPLTCEIQHGCTFFSEKGVWQKAMMPDWVLWGKEVWQTIMHGRQGAVCMSMGHCPKDCPNGPHKEKEEYDHIFYEQR